MIKVHTIEQFYVLQYIRKWFYEKSIKVDIVDDVSLKVTDGNGAVRVFTWHAMKVIEEAP